MPRRQLPLIKCRSIHWWNDQGSYCKWPPAPILTDFRNKICQDRTSADEEAAYCTLVALVSIVMPGSIVSVPSTLNPISWMTSST